MNKKHLFYTSAAALPLLALTLASGVHAASTVASADSAAKPLFNRFQNIELTDAQKEAVKQAQALHEQAREILEKAGLPAHPFAHGRPFMKKLNLTDEQKATLEQAMTLRKEGKQDEAKALLESAGIQIPGKGMRGLGHRPQ
ncbi:hypothetical protein IT407_02690 [Candidatus Uhrbacteria bacterium]|nr:hypothetical protein [Candidatus Uhrbacteria bacterium]